VTDLRNQESEEYGVNMVFEMDKVALALEIMYWW
jgi:hypothetical protein